MLKCTQSSRMEIVFIVEINIIDQNDEDKWAIHVKCTYSEYKGCGLLILLLTLIFHFGEAPKIGSYY